MKRFIKTQLLVLIIIALTTTMSFSQNILNGIVIDSTVSITPVQLKETNLIFAEHRKLLIENHLLYEQINNYKKDINLLNENDSIRQAQIKVYTDLNNSVINDLNRRNKTLLLWKIGGIAVSSSLLILLLIK